ncbi:hypothetical protein CAPTEDRAFT_220516 [Capitella teleta]|uniref:PNPLA domain-containing protein n=1 Tax=Capitella teleta TaxID=283909 RepID=R7TN74_CAPTE|nr:hypothetical protein CAPTEDRAFT_220516 [Capitella teleta]|eukprot:ELT93006.1 hypothetical protein CAPTEDRAFT_220516 [Capitella teleta]
MSLAESLKTEHFDEVKALLEKNGPLDIENLVFEGGGAKGMFYIGVIKVLEDLGLLSRMKRFGGTSVGSIAAGVLAVGGTTKDVEKIFVEGNVAKLVYDSKGGKMSLIPNVIKKFGWNPADKLLKTIYTYFKEKVGNPEITFMELYKLRGVELCTVASNLSTMTPEYCHVKTTPDMCVARAIRSSASLPGIMQPVKINRDGVEEILVDGALVCNFPLHCYDGWFLSMKKEDSFFHRLGGTEPAFSEFNPKTLGVALFSALDMRLMKGELLSNAFVGPKRPNTKLANSRAKCCDKAIESYAKSNQLYDAGNRFLLGLREADLDRDGEISIQEFRDAFVDNKLLSDEDGKMLFGDDFDIETAFTQIDTDADGLLTSDEFLSFMQKRGVAYRAIMTGGGSFTSVKDFSSFFASVFNTISVWTGQAFAHPRDMERTLGVFTDYIRVTDFIMEHDDKCFALKVGMETTLKYIASRIGKSIGERPPTANPVNDSVAANTEPKSTDDLEGAVGGEIAVN